jgi:hypothetical protein
LVRGGSLYFIVIIKIRLPLIAALAVVALACARHSQDPSDPAAIEKDLKKRTAQDIWDAAEKYKFDPPADRLLTEKQVVDFVRMTALSARIREVAQRSLGEQADRAAAAQGRLSRMGESFAAVGSLRAYATADMRACLDLDLNPKEEQWVEQQIYAAIGMIDQIVSREKDVETAKTDLDGEIDPVLISRKKDAVYRAEEAKRNWEQSQDPAVLANAELVRKHRHELSDR